MLGLRLADGVSLSALAEQFGERWNRFGMFDLQERLGGSCGDRWEAMPDAGNLELTLGS